MTDYRPLDAPPAWTTRRANLWRPEAFQGWGKRRRYFEGWYVKLVARSRESALAVIPGVAYDEAGEGHAFVQVLDGIRNTAAYHRFPLEAFRPAADRFALELGGNRFSAEGLELDLPDLKGRVRLNGRVPWPVKAWSPGIMGWYAFVPFMECYHGIVSMDTATEGRLEHEGRAVDLDGGRAYLEKDWGRSFPSSWIWMQSNHFATEGTSMKLSVARIPWVRQAFVGFIAGVWHEGTLHRFTTYTGARLRHAAVHDGHVEVTLADRRRTLAVHAVRSDGGDLVSPVQGLMAGRVNETMTARIRVRLTDRRGGVLLDDEGAMAGLEVAGPYEELLPG